MVRKFITSFTFCIICLFCFSNSQAQTADIERGAWLLGVIFKLERMRDNAVADVQRYESEIQKCDSTIRKSENFIRLAQQKGNAEVEMIARDALAKANEARMKNEGLKRAAELRKKRAEIAIANVRNLLAKQLSVKSEIKSVVTGYSGDVYIFSRKRNETTPLGENSAGYLEPGDEIWTLGKSSAEMQFLDGRGTLRLGEYSRFRMEEDDHGVQTINMLKGKIYVAVDKLDEYRKMVAEKLKAYKEDVSTVKDEIIRKIVDEYEKKKDRIEKVRSGRYYTTGLLGPLGSAPLIRTPTAVFGVRGTKFLVFEDETVGTELIVLEGTVEVKAINGQKAFPVDTGNKIRVTNDGVISKPEHVDLSKLQRWWEM
jgi:hypothetical protein